MKNHLISKADILDSFLALQMEKEESHTFSESKEIERLTLRASLKNAHGMNDEDIHTCIREERNFRTY